MAGDLALGHREIDPVDAGDLFCSEYFGNARTLSIIHLRNLLAAAEAGAAIVPPMVTHYHGPATIADMNRHLLGKALGRMNIDLPGMRRWGEEE